MIIPSQCSFWLVVFSLTFQTGSLNAAVVHRAGTGFRYSALRSRSLALF